jgi:hypothetical protein
MSRTVSFVTALLGLSQAGSARAGDFVVIQNQRLQEAASRSVGECCETSGPANLSWDFSCPKGAAAAPCLRGLVRSTHGSLRNAWERLTRELPPAMRTRIGARCGDRAGGQEQLACLDRALELSDPVIYRAALEPSFNLDAAVRAARVWKETNAAHAVFSMACERAQGNIVVTGRGRGRSLRQAKPADEACVTFPRLSAGEIPYEPSAPRPPPRDASPSPRPVPRPHEKLFDAYEGVFPDTIADCPEFIPRRFCGDGRFDPTHYRPRWEKVGTRTVVSRGGEPQDVDVYGTVYRYYEHPDVPIGEIPPGELMEGVYGAVRGELEGEVASFLADLFMERYLQQAALWLDGPARARARDELVGRAACLPGAAERAHELASGLPDDATLAPARARYRDLLALAAQCMGPVRDRLASLRHEMALDVEISRPVLKASEIETLPAGARHLVQGLTGLPIARHFLREAHLMTGSREAATRPCDFLQLRANPSIEVRRQAEAEVNSWTAPRHAYCVNVYAEQAAISRELDTLASAFPLLAGRDGGTWRYDRIVKAAGGADARVRGYSLDFNRARASELFNDDGPRSCMTRLRDPMTGLPSPPPAAAAAEAGRLIAAGAGEQLASISGRIADLCDPEKRALIVREAVRSPELMGQFFNCSRRRFATLGTLAWPERRDAGRAALDGPACRERINTAWVACRLHREVEHDERRDELLSQLLATGMDTLFFMAPGVGAGFAPSAGRVALGMAFGGAIGYALAPSGDERRLRAEWDVASFRAGYAPLAKYERALEALQAHDPKVEALLTGGVMGGIFGALASPGGARRAALEALETPANAALAEASLIQLYHAMKAEGRFTGRTGAIAEQQLVGLFDDTLRSRFPEVTEAGWQALSVEERIAILEGHLQAPRGPPATAAISASERARVTQAPEVNALRARHGTFSRVGPADNRRYISLTYEAGPERHLWFEIENILVKQLNDHVFRDRTVTQAVGNLYKELFFAELDRSPFLRDRVLGRYTDYKSIRMVFTESTPEVLAELRRVHEAANRAFARALRESPLRALFERETGLVADPATWHLAGAGASMAEAGTAARTARAFVARGGSPLERFEDVAPFLRQRLQRVERLRQEVAARIAPESGLLVGAPNVPGTPRVLSDEAIEILRKTPAHNLAEYVDAVRARIYRRFGIFVSRDDVRLLREYHSLVDGFAPGIFQETQTALDVSRGSHGLVTVDFAGQGARNIRHTMEALSHPAAREPKGAVRTARAMQDKASAAMMRLSWQFRDAVAMVIGRGEIEQIAISGDDGIYAPTVRLTPAQKTALVRRIAGSSENPGAFRLSFLPEEYVGSPGTRIPAEHRSALIVAADEIEKGVRARLFEGLARRPSDLRGLVLGVELYPRADGRGSAKLIASGDFPPGFRRKIEQAFRASLPDGFEASEIVLEPPLRGGETGGARGRLDLPARQRARFVSRVQNPTVEPGRVKTGRYPWRRRYASVPSCGFSPTRTQPSRACDWSLATANVRSS